MVTLENILHILIFAGCFIGIIIWSAWGINHKSRINYILSPILYFIHLLLFYALSVLGLISENIYIIWIDLVYIHSLFVLVSAGIVMTQLIKKESK